MSLVLAPNLSDDEHDPPTQAETNASPAARLRKPHKPTVAENLQAVTSAEEKKDDFEYNALLKAANGLASTVIGMRMIVSGSPPTHIADSLQNLSVHIMHSLHYEDGRRFVPGGPLNATRLGQSTQNNLPSGLFPHVLHRVPTGERMVVECDKRILLKAAIVENGDTGRPISQNEIARRLTAIGVAAGEVLFELTLRFFARDADGEHDVPSGIGMEKTFKGAFVNTTKDASQLLFPDENSPAYKIGLSTGCLVWSFAVRPGVTSAAAIPKDADFVFEVRCLHPQLDFLRASSMPFQLASRFRVDERCLSRGETYVESRQPGGEPERVITGKRKRGDELAIV